jgi:hypothetical protein
LRARTASSFSLFKKKKKTRKNLFFIQDIFIKMVTTLLNLRVKCVLKYSAFVIFFLVSFYYLRSISHSFSPVSKNSHWHKDVDSLSDSNGYKNSQNLVEKLRPKLVTSNTSDHHGEPIWCHCIKLLSSTLTKGKYKLGFVRGTLSSLV